MIKLSFSVLSLSASSRPDGRNNEARVQLVAQTVPPQKRTTTLKVFLFATAF